MEARLTSFERGVDNVLPPQGRGVVDQDVDPAELVDDGLDAPLDRVGVSKIELHGQ